jgi:hypothetical protein
MSTTIALFAQVKFQTMKKPRALNLDMSKLKFRLHDRRENSSMTSPNPGADRVGHTENHPKLFRFDFFGQAKRPASWPKEHAAGTLPTRSSTIPNAPELTKSQTSVAISPADLVASSRSSVNLAITADNETRDVDIGVLQHLASQHRGWVPCKCHHSGDYGSYNIVFFIEFDDGVTWVARLPMRRHAMRSLDDPLSQDTMSSVIATMQFVFQHTSIPVPEVYSYDVTSNNPLGRPYMLISKLSGTQLWTHVLEQQDRDKYASAIHSIVEKWGAYSMELAAIQFDTIGSLRRNADDEYVVGPLMTQHYLGLDSSLDKAVNSGPFISVADYLVSISNVKRHFQNTRPTTFGSHLRMSLIESLLPFFLDLNYLNGPFVLSHVDFDLQNILVDIDTGTITGVLDWDWAAVLPLQSHLLLRPVLNAEFLPASEFQVDNVMELDISKTYRKVYEDSMVAAAEKLGLQYPVEDILDRSLMYGLFEKALSYAPYEKDLPALWEHVFSEKISLEEIRDGMRRGDWAGAMASKWKVEVPSEMEDGNIDSPGKSQIRWARIKRLRTSMRKGISKWGGAKERDVNEKGHRMDGVGRMLQGFLCGR